jgi:hypothetical protein
MLVRQGMIVSILSLSAANMMGEQRGQSRAGLTSLHLGLDGANRIKDLEPEP